MDQGYRTHGLEINNTSKLSPWSPPGWLWVQVLAISAVTASWWLLPCASPPLHYSAVTGHAPGCSSSPDLSSHIRCSRWEKDRAALARGGKGLLCTRFLRCFKSL